LDAVVRTGGKQYRVHAGSVLNVATMDAEPGSKVELRDVLLVSDGPNVTIGSPTVDDAVVVAEVIEHGKGKKVVNFKYKAKVRYRRKIGHRQGYTMLSVSEIRHGASVTTAPVRRTSVAEPDDETPVETPVAEALTAEAPEAPASEAPKPAPRRRTRAAPKADETPVSEGETPLAEEKPAPRPRRRRTTTEGESS
jgi:large subunit ribosomal protein L21